MSTTTQPATSWHRGRVAGWIISVDHKRVGALYLGWAAVFLLIGGILPLLMRIQMTKPDAGFLGARRRRRRVASSSSGRVGTAGSADQEDRGPPEVKRTDAACGRRR